MVIPNDTHLSVAALGLWIRLLAHGENVFNLEDAQGAEPGGMGKDRALNLLAELKRADRINRTRGGYKLSSSSLELLNNYGKHRNPELRYFPELSTISHVDHESSDLREIVRTSEIPEKPNFGIAESEIAQQALLGMPGTPAPVPAPPSQAKPKRERRENPPEAKALYPAIFDLCKSGPHGGLAQACRNLGRDLWRDFQATPEQVTGYVEWRRIFSLEATNAAREHRPMRPPRPKFVYEDWPQFLPWWDARQADLARRAEAEQRRRERPAEPDFVPGDPKKWNPYRNRLGLGQPIAVATD